MKAGIPKDAVLEQFHLEAEQAEQAARLARKEFLMSVRKEILSALLLGALVGMSMLIFFVLLGFLAGLLM